MGVIKVAIADDHKIFRKGVILSLRPYNAIKFVQEAENGQELLDGLAASEPDVVLMDLRMPLKDGIETTKIIAKEYPSIHIIALTMYEDERFVSHMMEIGANGYLLKSADGYELIQAIETVHGGRKYVPAALRALMAARVPADQLTERELDVLRLLAEGRSLSEIAEALGVAYKTAANSCTQLKDNLGVSRTGELIRMAVEICQPVAD